MPLYLNSIVYVLCLTVSQYCFVFVISTGNSQRGTDRNGINLKVHVQTLWNAPEAYVTLNSPVVFELDTDSLPDVLGLSTWHPNVRVLIPDKKELDQGFHDVTLLDMADELEPAIPLGDLGLLQLQ